MWKARFHANPFPALYALVTRKDRNGFVIGPGEGSQPPGGAVSVHHGGNLADPRRKNQRHRLNLDKLADLVMLDRDYFTVSEEEIRDIIVR